MVSSRKARFGKLTRSLLNKNSNLTISSCNTQIDGTTDRVNSNRGSAAKYRAFWFCR
jgi:hypothetical protein